MVEDPNNVGTFYMYGTNGVNRQYLAVFTDDGTKFNSGRYIYNDDGS